MASRSFILLLTLTILSSSLAGSVKLPLKLSQNGKLYTSFTFGDNECPINMSPAIGFCTNFILKTDKEVKQCGATYVELNLSNFYSDYVAPAQITQTGQDFTLSFEVGSSDPFKPIFDVPNSICLGSNPSEVASKNIVQELFDQGLASSTKFFFDLNNLNGSNGEFVGQVEIGKLTSADESKLVELQGKSIWFATPVTKIEFAGVPLKIGQPRELVFNMNTEITWLRDEIFEKITQLLTVLDIEFVNNDKQLSINGADYEKLPTISFTLPTVNGESFTIDATKETYTKQLEDGSVKLLFKFQWFDTARYELSYKMLANYIVGFNVDQSMYISKREHQKLVHQNFRGSFSSTI